MLPAGTGEAEIGLLLTKPRGRLKATARALVKELLLQRRTGSLVSAAAFSVLSRLKIRNVNFIFIFAHILFLSCVVGFRCISRIN